MLNPRVQAALEHAGESALLFYGERSQCIAALEEMGELIRALSKHLLSKPITKEEIIDEVADVLIMLNQMRLIFGKEAVDDRALFKLDRTMNHIRYVRSEQERSFRNDEPKA